MEKNTANSRGLVTIQCAIRQGIRETTLDQKSKTVEPCHSGHALPSRISCHSELLCRTTQSCIWAWRESNLPHLVTYLTHKRAIRVCYEKVLTNHVCQVCYWLFYLWRNNVFDTGNGGERETIMISGRKPQQQKLICNFFHMCTMCTVRLHLT